MKRLLAFVHILLGMLILWSCDSQPLPPLHSNSIGQIHSRGIITATSIAKDKEALFSVTGQTAFTNQVFKFNGNYWENAGNTIPAGTIDSLTALYPAYNEEGNFITQNPYAENTLEDVLISPNAITGQTNLKLEFRHLFAKLTLHAAPGIQEELTGISLKAPKVNAINPINGKLDFAGEHSTYLSKSTTGDYTFIIPYKNDCTLELTFFMGNEEITKEITYSFESGHQYECNVTSTDSQPGIRTVDDLIDFSLLINGKSDKRPWSDFGYIEGEDTVYCLLNDIVITDKSLVLSPIGCHTQTPFAAIFDGRGYTISGLKISSSNTTAGLFGRITPKGIIKNLHLDNYSSPTFESGASSGIGLLASVCYGTIMNCSVTNSNINVTATSPTGALIGDLRKLGSVVNSFVQNTNVTSKGFAGSIAGSMNQANITNCYAASNTIKTGTYNGGITGSATNSDITNCYIYNLTFSNSTNRGQIIGTAQSTTIYRIFYDKTTIALINNNINEGSTIKFNRGYNTESFKTNNGDIDVFLLLKEWVDEQGENSIYTSWKDDDNLPAVFVE